MTTQSHHDHVEKQFSSQASEYLTSTVHASGRDLQRLAVRLADYPDASVLDMGCGAGHASFVAAQNVSAVVAYDLSAQMLDVVAQAAEARQLKNITTRQGYAESLPFARSEEHTSELQSPPYISYAVFCLASLINLNHSPLA